MRAAPEARRYYLDAFTAGCPTFPELRKIGVLADREELRAAGIRANAKVSRAFLDSLNETGRTDPLEAAAIVANSIRQALQSREDLRMRSGIYGALGEARLSSSPGAAGPCACATAVEVRRCHPDQADLLPLEGCDRPGQCFCMWSVGLEFD